MGEAAIITALLTYGPEAINGIVTLVNQYKAAGITHVTQDQVTADLAALDKAIDDFDAA